MPKPTLASMAQSNPPSRAAMRPDSGQIRPALREKRQAERPIPPQQHDFRPAQNGAKPSKYRACDRRMTKTLPQGIFSACGYLRDCLETASPRR